MRSIVVFPLTKRVTDKNRPVKSLHTEMASTMKPRDRDKIFCCSVTLDVWVLFGTFVSQHYLGFLCLRVETAETPSEYLIVHCCSCRHIIYYKNIQSRRSLSRADWAKYFTNTIRRWNYWCSVCLRASFSICETLDLLAFAACVIVILMFLCWLMRACRHTFALRGKDLSVHLRWNGYSESVTL